MKKTPALDERTMRYRRTVVGLAALMFVLAWYELCIGSLNFNGVGLTGLTTLNVMKALIVVLVYQLVLFVVYASQDVSEWRTELEKLHGNPPPPDGPSVGSISSRIDDLRQGIKQFEIMVERYEQKVDDQSPLQYGANVSNTIKALNEDSEKVLSKLKGLDWRTKIRFLVLDIAMPVLWALVVAVVVFCQWDKLPTQNLCSPTKTSMAAAGCTGPPQTLRS